MVQMKKRHARTKTDAQLSSITLQFLKLAAFSKINTGEKLTISINKNKTLELEPLFIAMASDVEIFEKLDLYLTREDLFDLSQLIKNILENVDSIEKKLNLQDVDTLEKIVSGEITVEGDE